MRQIVVSVLRRFLFLAIILALSAGLIAVLAWGAIYHHQATFNGLITIIVLSVCIVLAEYTSPERIVFDTSRLRAWLAADDHRL